MSGFLEFVADRGGDWVQWKPSVAAEQPELFEAAQRFVSMPNPAGEAATKWLKEEALNNHPSTVTWLLVRDSRVDAFIAMCSSRAKFSQSQRKRLVRRGVGLYPGKELHELHPIQPVAMIAWLAKARGSDVTAGDLLLQAAATALEVVEVVGQGQVAVTLEPFDEETAQFWKREYGFRKSQELDGHWCLWRTIMGDPDEMDGL